MNAAVLATKSKFVRKRTLQLVEHHFPSLWEKLRGARLFITGGTGFIGSKLIDVLSAVDEDFSLNLAVCVLSRDPKQAGLRLGFSASRPEFRVLGGDVRNFDFPDEDYSHFLHLAASTSNAFFSGDPLLDQFETCFYGTQHVLSYAKHCKADRFLMASSGAIYGQVPSKKIKIREDDCFSPSPQDVANAYAHGKRAAEFLVAHAHLDSGLETVVARCFSFLGPGLPLDTHFAVGNFINDALWCEEIVVKGDGKAMRSYMDISDLLVWLLVMLTCAPSGTVCNVGSDRAISILELAARVRDLLAPGKSLRVLGERHGDPGRKVYVPDISRARAELGLDIWTGLNDSINATARSALAERGE